MKIKIMRALIYASVSLVSGVLAANALAQAQGSWTMKAPVPARLNEVAVAAVGGKVHVLGGSVLGFTGPYHVEYDPAKDTWRPRAPVPRALDHIGAVVANGKIYAIGGRAPDGTTVATHEVYDPSTNLWKDLAPLPKARDHSAVITAEGKIYVAGGRFGASNEPTNMLDIYDPKTNAWSAGAPMPTPRSGLAGAYYKGLFLV